MKIKFNVNNMIYLIILLFIIVVIVSKSIQIHNKFKETFNNQNDNSNSDPVLKLESDNEEIERLSDDTSSNNTTGSNTPSDFFVEGTEDPNLENNISDDKLRNMCSKFQPGEKKWKSIISKYSGRVIDVEYVRKGKNPLAGPNENNNSVNKDSNNAYLYMIKWKPLGNKPGGCITCNANGTYSTPMCNLTEQNQLWHIVYIENRDDLMNIIPEQYQNMGKGRDVDNTEYPFYVVLSAQYNDKSYVLNYEGGGLSIRPIGNYDSIRWDVSEDPIQQDPLPTQNNSKYTSLTPEHNLGKKDNSLNKFYKSSMLEQENEKKNNDSPLNFNINLDPDLLKQLGLGFSGNNTDDNYFGNEENSNSNAGLMENTNVNEEADVILTPEELNRRKYKQSNSQGGRGKIDDMILQGADSQNCDKCGKVPPNYIKKDLVKSMCIGCNNIDNVTL